MGNLTDTADDRGHWVRIVRGDIRPVTSWHCFSDRLGAVKFACQIVKNFPASHVSVWSPDGKADQAWRRYAPG